MHRFLLASSLAGLASTYAQPAIGGPDFGYVYTAETEDPGETEVTLWGTDRRGKGEGHYDAQDYRLEVERGFSERFQASLYANFESHHVYRFDGEFEPVHRNFAFSGLEAEFKYKLLDPSHDRFGLAFTVEPEWSRIARVTGAKATEYEVELKAILQKNFLDDRLVWATNLTLEPEWEREHEETAPGVIEHETEKELALEVATGVTYRVAPNWWLGVEGRYHSVYPDWTHGLHRENYAVYAGPTVRFESGEWSVTATYSPQLFGGPNDHGNLEFDDHEKREFRLKISHEF